VTHRLLLRLAEARRRLLRLCHASGCLDTSCGLSRGSSSTTSTTPRVQVPRHVARLITGLVTPLVVDYFTYAACPIASARRAARRVARRRLLRLAQARRRLLHLRCASGCFGTSRDTSRHSSSTTSSHAGSSSTTSPTPRVRLLPHVATACRATHSRLLRLTQARRRLLHLRHASGCLGTSRDSSRGLSSTTLPPARVRVPRHIVRLVSPLAVDYFDYTARPGASARRAARHTARHRLLRAP
jgi:hypothetical protein